MKEGLLSNFAESSGSRFTAATGQVGRGTEENLPHRLVPPKILEQKTRATFHISALSMHSVLWKVVVSRHAAR